MVGQPRGNTLTATLRIPSPEFNAAVTDLKTLGNVEREEQMADEITEQEADLEARLATLGKRSSGCRSPLPADQCLPPTEPQ